MQITVRSMLVMIAASAVFLAAFRFHLSMGSFVSGVLALTFLRTFEVSRRCRGLGMPLSRKREASLFLWSLVIASGILGGSTIISVSLFLATVGSAVQTGCRAPSIEPQALLFGCASVGYWVCTHLRRKFWPYPYPEKPDNYVD